MCGVFGGHPELLVENPEEILFHRGPDQQGQQAFADGQGRPFTMGMTRLTSWTGAKCRFRSRPAEPLLLSMVRFITGEKSVLNSRRGVLDLKPRRIRKLFCTHFWSGGLHALSGLMACSLSPCGGMVSYSWPGIGLARSLYSTAYTATSSLSLRRSRLSQRLNSWKPSYVRS